MFFKQYMHLKYVFEMKNNWFGRVENSTKNTFIINVLRSCEDFWIDVISKMFLCSFHKEMQIA